ncbi:hypothetical protein K388_07472 [Streptomyces sp. KhCrAH-43]|uniref:hypothetical protein n=1 Tax=unclassified Streptomyces TaxID=2593676 RepID=UPI0003746087|nr:MULTISPECIES: hypothetical protein [unclassified Streptomyces]MYS32896.1 hypothetical protein [Streptomyces sp. SID4920]MYX67276.1 hypothetical protein [Streptomyces sp. SID8373]RAJ42589.1 hypothetical protein K388_07472 [Streptomyces sp. KhCrAH-43]
MAISLFIPELDGDTFPNLGELDEHLWALKEIRAEGAWLRAAETDDRYAWEEEQDRQRAAFFGYPY